MFDQLQALGYWSQRAYGPQVAGWDSWADTYPEEWGGGLRVGSRLDEEPSEEPD